MNEEFELTFSPEQTEALLAFSDAVLDLWLKILEWVEKVRQIILRTFDTLIKLWARQRLTEWRFPRNIANGMIRVLPKYLVYKLALSYLREIVQLK